MTHNVKDSRKDDHSETAGSGDEELPEDRTTAAMLPKWNGQKRDGLCSMERTSTC